MYKNKTFLAIIPARGGSKRLPRKNILDLNGKPLISYSIEEALKSKYIDKVVVSSDDDEILEVSLKSGAVVLKRPNFLATDRSSTFDAIEHAISKNKAYDYIVLLQPTSPLRMVSHIDEAIEKLESKDADAIVSVCEVEHSPLWMNTIPDNGNMDLFIKEDIKNIRSQDLKTFFRLNGAIYICKKDRLLKEKTFFFKNNIFSYEMEWKYSVDIDTFYDFKLAEIILSE